MSPRASYINTPQSPPMPRTPPAPALADIFEQRTKRERRLICELWLTCAATFRRMGKLEQAREAIQEAEGLDEAHPGVWVQVLLQLLASASSLTRSSVGIVFRGKRRGVKGNIGLSQGSGDQSRLHPRGSSSCTTVPQAGSRKDDVCLGKRGSRVGKRDGGPGSGYAVVLY